MRFRTLSVMYKRVMSPAPAYILPGKQAFNVPSFLWKKSHSGGRSCMHFILCINVAYFPVYTPIACELT